MSLQAINNFFKDIKANASVLRALGNPNNALNYYIDYINNLQNKIGDDCEQENNTIRRYDEYEINLSENKFFEIKNGDIVRKNCGTLVDYYQNSNLHIAHGITNLKRIGNKLYVCSIYGIYQYDENLIYEKTVVSNGGNFGSLINIAEDEQNYYIISSNHKVIAISKVSDEIVWTFGDGGRGNLYAGHLGDLSSIEISPNGNILVSTLNYKLLENGDYSRGGIIELNKDTGELVDVLFYYKNHWSWEDKSIYYIYEMKIYKNPLTNKSYMFISTRGNEIGVYEYKENENRWDFVFNNKTTKYRKLR